MFSWSSQGSFQAYWTDTEMVQLAAPSFQEFLKVVHEQSGLTELHIVAHSMGNVLVTQVMRDWMMEGREVPVVDQLVLAAPDIDAERFRREYLQRLPKFAKRVTVYVSAHDHALQASAGMRQRPRAGDVEGGLLGIEGLDTIDASTVKTGALNHAYYAKNITMLSDLHCRRTAGTPPGQRPLLKSQVGNQGR